MRCPTDYTLTRCTACLLYSFYLPIQARQATLEARREAAEAREAALRSQEVRSLVITPVSPLALQSTSLGIYLVINP